MFSWLYCCPISGAWEPCPSLLVRSRSGSQCNGRIQLGISRNSAYPVHVLTPATISKLTMKTIFFIFASQTIYLTKIPPSSLLMPHPHSPTLFVPFLSYPSGPFLYTTSPLISSSVIHLLHAPHIHQIHCFMPVSHTLPYAWQPSLPIKCILHHSIFHTHSFHAH